MADIGTDTAVDEDLLERTAAADDEQDHGNRHDSILNDLHDLRDALAARQAERVEGNHDGDRQRHVRRTEEGQDLIDSIALVEDELRDGRSRHQDDRHERRADGRGKARHLLFLEDLGIVHALRDLRMQVLRRVAEERASDDGRRDGDDEAVDECHADVGVIDD